MLEGRVALVTGASQGLGRALALAYAKEGAYLVLNSRSEGSIRPVAEEAENLGAEVLAFAADVSKGAAVEGMVGAAVERFGCVDVLVNNAGLLGPRVSIEDYPEEDPQTRITPEENTAVFLYLASDESKGVTGERFKAQEFRRT